MIFLSAIITPSYKGQNLVVHFLSLSSSPYNAIIMIKVDFVFCSFSSALSLVKPFLGVASESDKINYLSLVIWLWAQVVHAILIWLK